MYDGTTTKGRGQRRCRHCQRPKVNRPLGLCWGCYYTPGVRSLFSSESKYGRRAPDVNGGYSLPAEPTDARPGSRRKRKVLAARLKAGVALHHPEDARLHR